jgi:hypothetical protein
LFSLTGLNKEELDHPKLDLIKILLYDLLQTTLASMDPWFVEKIILEYHNKGLLREHIGGTGETMYQITEEFVVANWNLFSDEFRHKYRHELYEE